MFVIQSSIKTFQAANPVSMGKTRSKQLTLKEGDYSEDRLSKFGDKVLNVQVIFS